jgi:5-methylcytosine-specific restriction enzyme B
MINRAKLNTVLTAYKQQFAQHWPNERFKWEAVKHFQTHWNIEAPDFGAMLTEAMSKSGRLLIAARYFPLGMLQAYANYESETARAMFRILYDETQSIETRIAYFIETAEELAKKYWDHPVQSYQTANSISTYLWLRYPDKYYIYKFSEFLEVSHVLESDFVPKRGDNDHNLVNGFRMYDEIAAALAEDTELIQLVQQAMTPECYPDPALRTLTVDVGFFISRTYNAKTAAIPAESSTTPWWPSDYSPNLTTAQWLTLLGNPRIFTKSSLEIMKRFVDAGGEATCSALAKTYGQKANFYNAGVSYLAQRVYKQTNCPKPPEEPNAKWWPIVCLGRRTTTAGVYEWKLRPELQAALAQFDLSHVELYDPSEARFWWLDTSTSIPDFTTRTIGDAMFCAAVDQDNQPRAITQHFEDVKIGDYVICYTSTPHTRIVGLAIIAQDFDGIGIKIEKRKGFDKPFDTALFTESPILANSEYLHIESATLYHLREPEYDAIIAYIDSTTTPNVITSPRAPRYTNDDFLAEVYLTKDDLETLKSLLTHKRNLILQGAPGVGKTFAAKRLAYVMLGAKDDAYIEFVQFHQNTAYEDFVMGYRPHADGFTLQYGTFYRMCQRAQANPAQPHFFVIDEINRGNVSKIFGELLMLIESGYRGTALTMAYDGQPFSVPNNLFIIGMMNTADRSLAMIDYALRRRFSFFEMQPAFANDGFVGYRNALNSDKFNNLIETIIELNNEIAADPTLGNGHSYLCGLTRENVSQRLPHIITYDIVPQLREYWFDDLEKVEKWAQKLEGALRG